MKKLFCMLLMLALTLGAAAVAETTTYADPEGELAFDYDTESLEISMDDVGDDEHLVILTGTREDWGEYYIRFHIRELEDGESLPALEDFAEIEEALNTEATQEEWNGFKDTIMYSVTDDDGFEQTFIIPVYDADDGEAEALLTIGIRVSSLDDEEAGMMRDDAISDVLDTLKILDD